MQTVRGMLKNFTNDLISIRKPAIPPGGPPAGRTQGSRATVPSRDLSQAMAVPSASINEGPYGQLHGYEYDGYEDSSGFVTPQGRPMRLGQMLWGGNIFDTRTHTMNSNPASSYDMEENQSEAELLSSTGFDGFGFVESGTDPNAPSVRPRTYAAAEATPNFRGREHSSSFFPSEARFVGPRIHPDSSNTIGSNIFNTSIGSGNHRIAHHSSGPQMSMSGSFVAGPANYPYQPVTRHYSASIFSDEPSSTSKQSIRNSKRQLSDLLDQATVLPEDPQSTVVASLEVMRRETVTLTKLIRDLEILSFQSWSWRQRTAVRLSHASNQGSGLILPAGSLFDCPRGVDLRSE